MSLSPSKKAGLDPDVGESFPVARVVDRHGREIMRLYYSYENVNLRLEEDIDTIEQLVSNLVDNACETLRIKLTTKTLRDIEADIIAQEPPKNRYGKRIYDHVSEILGTMESKFFRCAEGYKIEPLPRGIHGQTQRYYISGMSGSGKSTLTGIIARNYLAEKPGFRCFLFSIKEYDPALDEKIPGLIRIKMDREFVRNYEQDVKKLLTEDFANSLVIFDDIEGITDSYIAKTIVGFKDSALRLGRSSGLSVITIMHKSLSGKASVVDLSEASDITIHPSTNNSEASKLLAKYCYFDAHKLSRIFDDAGKSERWMIISRGLDLIITQNYIKIVK